MSGIARRTLHRFKKYRLINLIVCNSVKSVYNIVMRERGPGPVSSMAEDDERRHLASSDQLRHSNLELGGKGVQEYVVFQAKGSVFNG